MKQNLPGTWVCNRQNEEFGFQDFSESFLSLNVCATFACQSLSPLDIRSSTVVGFVKMRKRQSRSVFPEACTLTQTKQCGHSASCRPAALWGCHGRVLVTMVRWIEDRCDLCEERERERQTLTTRDGSDSMLKDMTTY